MKKAICLPRCSLRTADAIPVVTSLPPEILRLRTREAKRFPWPKVFLVDQGLARKIKELTRETSRKIVRRGYVYKSKLKGRRSLCTVAALFSQNDAFTKVNESSFLIPRRKVCFWELFDSLSCAALDIFLVDILYLWKVGRVVIDFPCVVASWFRQNFNWSDRKHFIFVLIFL